MMLLAAASVNAEMVGGLLDGGADNLADRQLLYRITEWMKERRG
jgi:hypothetical protein